jgi:hypothetical protein
LCGLDVAISHLYRNNCSSFILLVCTSHLNRQIYRYGTSEYMANGDDNNNKKLTLIAKTTCLNFMQELKLIEKELVMPSPFIKACIYNINHQLKLLQKQWIKEI